MPIGRRFALVCLVLVFGGVAQAQDKWDIAARALVRVKPADIRGLPDRVRRELESRGCTVPRPHPSVVTMFKMQGVGGVQNVIRGSFEKPGQIDWAIMCSRAGESSVFVFRLGSKMRIDSLSGQSDRESMEEWGDSFTYDRQISVAHASAVRKLGPKALRHASHDGIEYSILEKAAEIYFWQTGRLYRFVSGD